MNPMERHDIIQLAIDIGLSPISGQSFDCTVSDLEMIVARTTDQVTEEAALTVEQLGMQGYGALAIAALLRLRRNPDEQRGHY